MLQGLKKRVINLKTAGGLRLRLLPDNSWEVALLVLQQQKGLVTIADQWQQVGDMAALQALTNDDTPYFVVLDGKGILHKAIDIPGNLSKERLLQRAIPNAKPDDFYVQTIASGGGQVVSVVRKTIVAQVLATLQKHGMHTTGLTLGPFGFMALVPFMDAADTRQLLVDGYQLEAEEGTLIAFSRQPTPADGALFIGDERVGATMGLAYAAALQAFLPAQPAQMEAVPEQLHDKDEWEQKRIFRFAFKAVLGLLFVVLLVNFVLNFQYSQTNGELSSAYAVKSGMITRLNQLGREVDSKRTFLDNLGWDAAFRPSYFADRLATTIPKGVTLNSLDIHPLDVETLRRDRISLFLNNRIAVAGTCKGPLVLNQWVRQVEALPWVQGISDLQYDYDQSQRTGRFNFTVLLGSTGKGRQPVNSNGS